MVKLKHFMILALALAMSLGAWAQTHTVTWDGDALQSVNVSSAGDVKTQTIGGITVTANNGYFRYSPEDGVNAAPYILTDNGLVFSSTVNILSVEVNTTSTNSTFASSSGAETSHTYTVSPASTQFVLDDPDQWIGITSIVFTLDGVPAPTVTHNADGSLGFTMPDYDAALNVTYYSLPALAWTYNSAAMPAEGLTAYRGFELPVIGGIGASMNEDFLTALQNGTVSLHYGSVNGVVTFTNSNDRLTATVTGSGLDTVYMVFDGNDDFLADSAYFAVKIADPDTLTLASNDTDKGTVSALMGGGNATWTTETWAGTATGLNLSPLTYGDITVTATGGGIRRYDSDPEPIHLTAYTGYNHDITFSSNGGNFSRIEMTCGSSNPFGGVDQEGWTVTPGAVSGSTAVWEGDAASVTITSCTTMVSQITFVRGGNDSIVATATEGQYLVISGAEVQVVATATDGNYVQGWNEIDKAVTNVLSDTATIVVNQSQTLTATFAQNPLLTLATDGQGSVSLDGVTPGTEDQSESFTTNQGLNTYTGQNFTVTCTSAGDGDGIQIGDNNPITITSTNGQNINRVEFHINLGYPQISTISSTPGTVVGGSENGTEGNCSITGINATSVSFSSSYDGWIQINQITVYYGGTPATYPDGIAATETDNTYRVLPGTQLSVTATPGEGSYLAQWSDQTEPVEGDARLGSSHPYTMPATPATLTATFNEIPVLTLATNNSDWGTVTLDGVTPGATTYNITIEGGNTYTNVSFPFHTTVFLHEGLEWVEAIDQYPLSVSKDGNNAVITINEPYGGGKAITYEYFYDEEPWVVNKSIFCTGVQGAPIMPEGVVTYAGYGNYLVLPGTEVKVIATPDSAHYFVNWDEETALNSNTAVEKTLTMGFDDTELTANFAAKPTLTLASNNSQWGSVEMPLVAAETLLTTINASGSFTSGSQAFDNVATVTFAGQTTYEWSVWMAQYGDGKSGTITLSAAEGVNVTGYKLYFNYADPYTITASSATLNLSCEGGGRYVYYLGEQIGYEGISKIEVYSTVSTLPAGVTQLTDSTYRVDYGTVVRATATAKDGYHMDSWSNGAAVTDLLVNNNTVTVTTDSTIRANFIANPLLTLASNNSEWGTVEMEGAGSGSSNGYTIKFSANGNTIVKENVTLPKTYQCEYGSPSEFDNIIRELYGWTGVHGNENAIPTVTGTDAITPGINSDNYPKFTINSAFQGTATVTIGYTNSSWESDNWPIEISFVPAMPAGVLATEQENVYSVLPGTTVTVNATAADGYHISSWSNDAEVNSLTAASQTLTVTDDLTLTATFAQNPLLTLASNNSEWGTVALDAGAPEETLLTTINSTEPNNTFTSGSRTFDNIATITFSGSVNNYNDLWGWNSGEEVTLTVTAASEDYTITRVKFYNERLTVHSAFDEEAPFQATLQGGHAYVNGTDLDQYGVTKIEVYGYQGAAPDLPAGVLATEQENVYNVLPGTEVKVIATPDSAHYFVNWDEETALNSNTAVDTTFQMGFDNETLAATFAAKPVLTLAQNDGGEMEVIPAGGVTAIVPPTDQIDDWKNNYAGRLSENDISAALGFVAVDQAAAEAWTGAPASGNIMLIYGFNGEYLYYLSFRDGSLTGNSVATSTPGGFYNMASNGILYITTGVTPSNVTATAEPNTYYIDYGTSVTVKATPSDTTYLVRFDQDADTNSNTAVEKTYGPLTANDTARATFNDKPVLTLAANDTTWGKVMLEGAASGSGNGYTIKFSANGNTIVKENVTLPKTYQCNYGSPSEFDNIIRELYGWTGVHGNENAIPTVTGTDAITPGLDSRNNNYPKFTINSAFQGTATVTIGYTNSSWVSDNWPIEISFVPALPAGVAQLDSVTYRVDYGTEVTVIADATELHHVANWEDQNADTLQTAIYSNYFVTTPENLFPDSSALTFTVTTDTIAKAVFGINSYDVTARATVDSREVIGTDTAMGVIACVSSLDIQGNPQTVAPDSVITYTAQGGSTSKLVAEPYYGYQFKHWQVGNGIYTTDTLTLTEAATVTAVFVPDTFTVSATPSIAGSATLSGTGRVAYRESTTLAATPETGYHFTEWTDAAATALGTSATLTVQALGDSSLVAVMDTNVYNVTVNVNEVEGSVEGPATVKHFVGGSYTATATPCYHFVSWTDAAGTVLGSEATLVMNATSDTAITANYALNVYTGDTTAVECDQFVWHGETYTVTPATAPTFVYKNANNCDSTVTLHLTVNYQNTGDTTAVECDQFSWYEHTGLTASTEKLTHLFACANQWCCDSTVTLHLTVNYRNTGDTSAVECDQFSWYEHTGLTASTETLTHLFAGANQWGCDSTVTLHLTVNYQNTGVETATACDRYTWEGTVYTTSNYRDTRTLANVWGCDSVVTLDLTIYNHHDTTVYWQTSGNFTWNGETFTTYGTYDRVIKTVDGCDSNITIVLAYLPKTLPLPRIYNMMDVALMIDHFEGGSEERLEYIYYRWYKNGVVVDSGEYKDSYSEEGRTLEGCFYLEISTDADHKYWAQSDTICIGTTGIDNVEAISMAVAPNPVMRGARVTIALSGVADLQGATLTVYDAQGRKAIEQSDATGFDAPQTAGIYTVRLVLNDGRMATRKVVVR